MRILEVCCLVHSVHEGELLLKIRLIPETYINRGAIRRDDVTFYHEDPEWMASRAVLYIVVNFYRWETHDCNYTFIVSSFRHSVSQRSNENDLPDDPVSWSHRTFNHFEISQDSDALKR